MYWCWIVVVSESLKSDVGPSASNNVVMCHMQCMYAQLTTGLAQMQN